MIPISIRRRVLEALALAFFNPKGCSRMHDDDKVSFSLEFSIYSGYILRVGVPHGG